MFNRWLSLLLFVVAVQATTYYVEEGGLYSIYCTQVTPCGTIQAAVNVATNYSTIEIGPGTYYENIQIKKAGLTLVGAGKHRSIVVGAGGIDGVQGPRGTPLEVIIDIYAPNVTIRDLKLTTNKTLALKREFGIYFQPLLSQGGIAKDLIIERNRGNEPGAGTGSEANWTRALVIYSPYVQATGCTLKGPWYDSFTTISNHGLFSDNTIQDAQRNGIIVIDFTNGSNDNNIITNNRITNSSLGDGIQIQTDSNVVQGNIIRKTGRYGIYLCNNSTSATGCDEKPRNTTSADDNVVQANIILLSKGQKVVDEGQYNVVQGA